MSQLFINKFKSYLFILVILISGKLHAGGEVQNGGDFVFCTKSAESDYQGYYSLDFLLTLQNENGHLVDVKSWADSKKRILALLTQKFPDLAVLFQDFLSRIPGETTEPPFEKYFHQRLWDDTPYGLEDLQDERIIRKIPANCYNSKLAGKINTIQAIIREKNSSSIVYNYDSALIAGVKTGAPLQFSYLMVHEWLWDFADDVNVIRRINRLLHSNLLNDLSPKDFKQILKNMGLSLTPQKFLTACNRNEQITKAVEFLLKKSCDQIDPQDLTDINLQILQLKNRGLTSILPGDLAGLTKTFRLLLNSNRLSYLFDDTFFGMLTLLELDLSDNQIKALPINLLRQTPSLYWLNLNRNQIQEIPTGFFAAICEQNYEGFNFSIDLTGNPIAKIDWTDLKACMDQIYINHSNRNVSSQGFRMNLSKATCESLGPKIKEFDRNLFRIICIE